jgi:uncharacterized membrane protein
MSSTEHSVLDPLLLTAALAAMLALSACAALSSRPSPPCTDSMEQPYGVCDTSVG